MITIADVMRHSGGVPWFADPAKVQPGGKGTEALDFIILTAAESQQPAVMSSTIEAAARQPEGEGVLRCYHGATRGCVVDSILQRVDPQKRGIVQFIAEEICGPLGITNYHPCIPEAEQSNYNIAHVGPPASMFQINMKYGPAAMGIGDPDIANAMQMFARTF